MATLAVCLDGTNQTKIKATNIGRIFDSLGGAAVTAGHDSFEAPLPGGGISKYLPGVGTQGNMFLQVLGNAFGDGIAEQIIRGYTFLSRNYAPGDQIFIVGFSRGATAARALAGFVVSQGLMVSANYNPGNKDDGYARAIAAWYRYRLPRPDLANQFRLQLISGTIGQPVPTLTAADFTAPPQIQAVGVFDTVSSLGTPHLDINGEAKFDFSICDMTLSPNVLHGFHALAADESRDVFAPTFWAAGPQVTQHIFPGYHSNVGGGFADIGLSDGSLDWMLSQLSGVGMPCNPANIAGGVHPLPKAPAQDDGATPPFNILPHHPRRFPLSATVDAFLTQRRNAMVAVIPDTTLKAYSPHGIYINNTPL